MKNVAGTIRDRPMAAASRYIDEMHHALCVCLPVDRGMRGLQGSIYGAGGVVWTATAEVAGGAYSEGG